MSKIEKLERRILIINWDEAPDGIPDPSGDYVLYSQAVEREKLIVQAFAGYIRDSVSGAMLRRHALKQADKFLAEIEATRK